MSFRLVSNSVTLDELERRNSSNRRVISTNLVAFGADYVRYTSTICNGNVGHRVYSF